MHLTGFLLTESDSFSLQKCHLPTEIEKDFDETCCLMRLIVQKRRLNSYRM